jgi:hypothetical protein
LKTGALSGALLDEVDMIDKVSVASDELSVQMITHVDILGRMDRTFPASGSDDLHMNTLPIEDDHVSINDQDVPTDTPENTDGSTPSDEIFQIDSSYDEDQWDSAMDEAVIYGEGIVSSFASFVLHTFERNFDF